MIAGRTRQAKWIRVRGYLALAAAMAPGVWWFVSKLMGAVDVIRRMSRG